jgi:aspartate aminotransferase-like enzyme
MKTNGITVSGGQDRLDGKIFRIPSMNAFTEDDLVRTFTTLEQTLVQFKVIPQAGAGVEALRKVYKN